MLKEAQAKENKREEDLIYEKSENAMKKWMHKSFKVELKVDVTSHDFRHSKITDLHESGM